VSDAFRMMTVRIAKEKALPFEPLIPNAETIEAMEAARRREFVGEFKTVDEPPALLNVACPGPCGLHARGAFSRGTPSTGVNADGSLSTLTGSWFWSPAPEVASEPCNRL
jgi:hypothetical protein